MTKSKTGGNLRISASTLPAAPDPTPDASEPGAAKPGRSAGPAFRLTTAEIEALQHDKQQALELARKLERN